MRIFKTKWFVRFARREQIGDRAVFLYGFAKNERENIDDDELTTLREIAAGWLEADDKHLENAIGKGFLQEVNYGNGK